jgi:hypothetical protein
MHQARVSTIEPCPSRAPATANPPPIDRAKRAPGARVLCFALLALASTACSSRESEAAFAAAKTSTSKEEVRLGTSSAERFRFQGMPGAKMPAASSADEGSQGWHWTTPPGWSELPATAMRLANFRVAGDAHAECYLTSLAGDSGGLAGNVNRWRTQMSQPPLSAEQIAALPRVPWLGRSAVELEVDGTWGGMSGSESSADYRLVGLLLVDPSGSHFLKMIGPRELIARETPAFLALAASLHEEGAGHEHAAASTTAGAAPGDAKPASKASVPNDPHASDPNAARAGSAGPAPTASETLAWTVPKGWSAGAQKAMREVTFLAGENRSVECYIALLAGDGGGLRSNLDRWRQQFGREALSDAELEDLPRVPMLGTEARVIEVTRPEEGPNDMVIGAVCLLPDRSVFVKMTGPRAQVTREREAFLEFCRSLRPVR